MGEHWPITSRHCVSPRQACAHPGGGLFLPAPAVLAGDEQTFTDYNTPSPSCQETQLGVMLFPYPLWARAGNLIPPPGCRSEFGHRGLKDNSKPSRRHKIEQAFLVPGVAEMWAVNCGRRSGHHFCPNRRRWRFPLKCVCSCPCSSPADNNAQWEWRLIIIPKGLFFPGAVKARSRKSMELF